MKSIALATLVLMTFPLAADQQHVAADEKMNFSTAKTFALREGSSRTASPELNNKLVLKQVEEAIRSDLSTKGLMETQDRPDLMVSFSIGEDRPRGPGVEFDEGTLVIQFTRRETNSLVWHGVYRDDKATAASFAPKLTDDVRKLLSRFPPKKNK